MSLTIANPATAEPVETLAVDDPAAVSAAAARLRAAQPEWEALGPEGRAAALRRFRDWIIDNTDALADRYQPETGKPRQDAVLELLVAVDALDYYAGNAARFLGAEKRRAHSHLWHTKRLEVSYRPHQLAGVITPWNFPVALVALDVSPALAAGCAVLLKPSEVNPLTVIELVRGWSEELGLPPVWECVVGGAETGEAVVDASDYVQFTGSTATGRKIMSRAADTLTPVGLELGGKDAMIVLADADLERAANGAAWGAMFNSGQTCISVERIYVEAPAHDEFVRLLTEKVAALRQGADDRGFNCDLGAMMTEGQIEIVERHVSEALEGGARALTGGRRREGDGRYYEPTVLVDVEQSMDAMQEETFGPTAAVLAVADAEEAIEHANDSPYGLSATVWTRDRRRAREIARRLDVGAVNTNDVYTNIFNLGLPHGGWKGSGIGARNGGADAVRKYCRKQAYTEGRLDLKSEVTWFPYRRRKNRIFRGLTNLLAGGGLRRKLGLGRKA